MAATTTQLGLVTPTQGDLTGTWGNVVNNGITEYTNIAIAGTTTFNGDGAVTLENTTGNASATNIGSTTAQYMVIRVTGTLTTPKIITAPSYSKLYLVDNAATGSTVTFKASGQTGVSVAVGESAFVYYNGTDYIKVASDLITALTGTLGVANGGTGLTTLTANNVILGNGTSTPSFVAPGTNGNILTSNGTTWTSTAPAAGTTFSAGTTGFTPSTATSGAVTLAGTLNVANGGTGLTSLTAGYVPFGNGTSALGNSANLFWDNTNARLGIGTSSPTTILHTVGANATLATTLADSVTYAKLRFQTASSSSLSLYQGTTGSTPAWYFQIANGPGTGSYDISLNPFGGNVGFGTTSPAVKMQLGDGSSGQLKFRIYRGSGSDYTDYFSDTGSTVIDTVGGGSFFLRFGGTQRFQVTAAGGLSVGTTSDPGAGAIYATGNITAFFSDKRLKTVSGKIENALDKVAKLSGVYYTFNDTAKSFGYDSDEVQVGVLAQEVEAVLPQIVKAAPFDLDENNNSKSGENYKTVQYDKLVPLLIEAINELRAEVKALKGV